MRRYYIDNLRWMVILLLIPYHAAQAWNTWGEPNYIFFEGNRAISSIIVTFSPFIMPLLFLFAGMSTRFALKKRSIGRFVVERVTRLLVPFLFGVAVFVPVMTYLAHKYNYGYSGGFIEHYCVFFTHLTDWTGADGAFSLGQFWFLLYLFVISLVALCVIVPLRRKEDKCRAVPLWVVVLLGLPLPLLHEVLSVGGKSFAEFLYLFLIGYFVFSEDKVISGVSRFGILFLFIGIAACIANVYMFIWSGKDYGWINNAANFVAEWFMVLGLVGVGKDHLEFRGKVSGYLSKISFAFFSLHFVIVVALQYLLAGVFGDNVLLLFFVPVLVGYLLTFIMSSICVKVPGIRFLLGIKK